MSIRFHYKHPLAFTAVFLVIGALFPFTWILIILGLSAFILLLKKLCLREFIILCGALILGFTSHFWHFYRYSSAQKALTKATYVKLQVVTKSDKNYGTHYEARLKSVYELGYWRPFPGFRVDFSLKKDLGLLPGARILIEKPHLKVSLNPQFPFLFDAEVFNWGIQRLGTINLKSAKIYVLKLETCGLESQRYRFKNRLIGVVKPCLSERSAALFAGLILGDKDGIEDGDRYLFQQAGLMHILSVSGMHLGLIYWLISWPLKQFTKQYRWLRNLELLGLPVLWLYAYLTGMAPPVFRAAAFISAFLGAQLILKRRVRMADILCSAACLQVIFDPLTLHSVSFQLSFAAMIGIAFFFPLWQEFWQNNIGKLIALGDLLGISICCTLSTLPLTLFHFHAIPTWFLLGNLIFTFPFTLLIYMFLALSISVFLPFGFLTTTLGAIANWGVESIHTLLLWESLLPIPYIYAYDFNLIDVAIMSLLLFAFWRLLSGMLFIQGTYLRFGIWIWVFWGLIRVPSANFSGDIDARKIPQIQQKVAAGRWAQSQGIDTLRLVDSIGGSVLIPSKSSTFVPWNGLKLKSKTE